MLEPLPLLSDLQLLVIIVPMFEKWKLFHYLTVTEIVAIPPTMTTTMLS